MLLQSAHLTLLQELVTESQKVRGWKGPLYESEKSSRTSKEYVTEGGRRIIEWFGLEGTLQTI